jgi:hypothetical protein
MKKIWWSWALDFSLFDFLAPRVICSEGSGVEIAPCLIGTLPHKMLDIKWTADRVRERQELIIPFDLELCVNTLFAATETGLYCIYKYIRTGM